MDATSPNEAPTSPLVGGKSNVPPPPIGSFDNVESNFKQTLDKGTSFAEFKLLADMRVRCQQEHQQGQSNSAPATQVDLLELVSIAQDAGAEIMRIYNGNEEDWDTQVKSDNSPLTAADKAANKIICDRLKKLYPSIPIMSEEDTLPSYEERQKWHVYFCVDPLDGTKEFIQRNGQFTVNIGLVRGDTGEPLAGVVGIPAEKTLYFAAKKQGAYKEFDEKVVKVQAASFTSKDEGLVVVASRSHRTPETQAFIDRYTKPELKSLGSSIKLLLVAEGSAHVYPRLAPTCEWDTCAAQAIVEEAGGVILQLAGGDKANASPGQAGEPLRYNKENVLNPFFLVLGHQTDIEEEKPARDADATSTPAGADEKKEEAKPTEGDQKEEAKATEESEKTSEKQDTEGKEDRKAENAAKE